MATESSTEFNSIFDTPEMKEFSKQRNKQLQFEYATTRYSDQLRTFLEFCNKRGSAYRPGLDQFPRHVQIAKYCNCAPSTIYRIMTGEQKSISTQVCDVLLAISCISPAPSDRRYSVLYKEQRSRIADADAWADADPNTRGDILDVLFAGIKKREQRRERNRQKKEEAAKS